MIIDVNDKTARTIPLEDSRKEFVLVSPHEEHVVTNLSPLEVCELLLISSEEYDSSDPDTFRSEVK